MKVQEAGLFDAKTHLSEMVEKVEKRGVVYRITRRGKQTKVRLPFGYGAGTVPFIASDFDAPLDDLREYME
jgi:hypothetical protein